MILGLTPARGGSKGIPRKNIANVGGKPLIAWTIEQALASNHLDDFMVSTEDQEIAEVVEQLGARVLWRPPELASDEVETLPVLQHALESVPADTLVLLQATSPVRDKDLIDRCILRYQELQVDSLATGFNCKFVEYGSNTLPRQQIDGFFYDDGNVYVMDGDMVRSGDRFGKKIERLVLDREQNAEIDDEFDLWLVQQILRRRNPFS